MRSLKFLSNFDTLSLQDKLLLLFGSQETDINTSLVINYVSKCFETRAMHHEQ